MFCREHNKNGRMCPLKTDSSNSSLSKQRHNSRMEKVAKSKIKFGLPVMAHDLVGKIQMICLRGT
jgi:hypothetical protein